MVVEKVIEEDDDNWLDLDPEWEEKNRLMDIQIKIKIQKCIDAMDRLIERLDKKYPEYDKLKEFEINS